MRFDVIDEPQRSPGWFAARLGRLTSTGAADMLAKSLKSGGEPACRRDLRTRLVLERLTNQPQEDGYVSPDMMRGVELEADAFAAYEATTGQMVQRVGFLQMRDQMVGASPDGVIGAFEGVLEIKVPKSTTHLGYLRAGEVPVAHFHQIVHHLYVSGADYCDFFSFDPRFPEPLRVFHRRVERKTIDFTAYELAVSMFLTEVERELAELQDRLKVCA